MYILLWMLKWQILILINITIINFGTMMKDTIIQNIYRKISHCYKFCDFGEINNNNNNK